MDNGDRAHFHGKILCLISVYGLQSDKNEQKEDCFIWIWVVMFESNGKCIVLGDFNRNVGSTIYGYKNAHGRN